MDEALLDNTRGRARDNAIRLTRIGLKLYSIMQDYTALSVIFLEL